MPQNSLQISREHFLQMMEDVSVFGATPAGGLDRQTASAADGEARRWLMQQFHDAGMQTLIDPVGNMFGMLTLADPDADIVLAGSHLDSQPNGGRFDGAYGVVAALAATRAVGQSFTRTGQRATKNLAVVNWTNEEGARFAPSLLGSHVFIDKLDIQTARSATDAKGITLAAALDDIGFTGTDTAPKNIHCYLEVHIEQGPHLENEGKCIGIVEGNWGTVKYEVEFQGQSAHTGPTPMSERRDPLLPAAELILFVRALSDEEGGMLLSSIARIDVMPNSTNVVPERVRVFAELRDADGGRLAKARRRFEDKVMALNDHGIRSTLKCVVDRPAGEFDAGLACLIEEVAKDNGYPSMRMRTIAGHDAVAVAKVLPSAMLFVPSADGVSHNEAEYTRPEDLIAGADVLAGVLARLVVGDPA
jgi:beta-ureidopropionase / N-carbamoyl-L-amino-acid hydrolase